MLSAAQYLTFTADYNPYPDTDIWQGNEQFDKHAFSDSFWVANFKVAPYKITEDILLLLLLVHNLK